MSDDTIHASRDGAHLRFTNVGGYDVTWSSPASGGDTVAAGTTVFLTLLDRPGLVTLTCDRERGPDYTARFRIVDDERHHVSDALSCRKPKPSNSSDPVVASVPPAAAMPVQPADETPEFGDPTALTGRYVAGERTSHDVVEAAGYVDAPVRTFRIRRGDQIWAVLRWVPAHAQSSDERPSSPNGGWFLRSAESCTPL